LIGAGRAYRDDDNLSKKRQRWRMRRMKKEDLERDTDERLSKGTRAYSLGVYDKFYVMIEKKKKININ